MENDTSRFGGVDWAADAHAIAVVDQVGAVLDEFEVDHSAPGLDELCRRLTKHRVTRVALERPDGPVVDALLGNGFGVVVVSSRSVKALRERYGTAGNKSDRSDAYVLADCLRTDGHRWRDLRPDSPATVTLREHVRARKDLVETRVALANQLRAHLQIVFPGAVGLFADIDSPISLRFLERFPSADRAAWLSEKRLGAWLVANAYCGRKSPVELYRHLREAPAGSGDDGEVRAAVVLGSRRGAQGRASPDRRADHSHGRTARGSSRRRHLHLAAPSERRESGHPSRRDRRLPGALSRSRVAGLPGRGGTLDSCLGQTPRGHLPLEQ